MYVWEKFSLISSGLHWIIIVWLIFPTQDRLELGQRDWPTCPRRWRLQGNHQGLQPRQHELHQVWGSSLDGGLLTQAFTDILWATETPSMNWSFTLKIQIFCCPCQRTMPWGCGMLRKAVDWDCKNNLRFDNLLYSKKARKTRIFLVSLHYRSKLPLIMIRYSYNSQSAASLRLNTTSQYSEELRDTGTRSSVLTSTWMEPGSFPVVWITVSRCGGWTQKIYRLVR